MKKSRKIREFWPVRNLPNSFSSLCHTGAWCTDVFKVAHPPTLILRSSVHVGQGHESSHKVYVLLKQYLRTYAYYGFNDSSCFCRHLINVMVNKIVMF